MLGLGLRLVCTSSAVNTSMRLRILDEGHDTDAEDACAAEVAARIEAVRAGTTETITTNEALTQARARLTARRG